MHANRLWLLFIAICYEIISNIIETHALSTQVVLVAHKKNVEYLEKEGSYKNSTKEGTLLKLGKLL